MLDINNGDKITIEEAEKLLMADCNQQNNDAIFDIYGNYNYPFETKLTSPNTAVSYIGKITV